MLEFSMQLHITTPKWLETTAHLRIHQKSRYPPGRPWWALMDRHLKREKSWKKHANCDLLHRVDSYNLTTSNNKQPPAFQSLANIRINYSTTVVVSTVAGFQSSTLLHVPSSNSVCLRSCNFGPLNLLDFLHFTHRVFVRNFLTFRKISPKSRAFILVVEPQPNRISLEASVGTWKMIVYIYIYNTYFILCKIKTNVFVAVFEIKVDLNKLKIRVLRFHLKLMYLQCIHLKLVQLNPCFFHQNSRGFLLDFWCQVAEGILGLVQPNIGTTGFPMCSIAWHLRRLQGIYPSLKLTVRTWK